MLTKFRTSGKRQIQGGGQDSRQYPKIPTSKLLFTLKSRFWYLHAGFKVVGMRRPLKLKLPDNVVMYTYDGGKIVGTMKSRHIFTVERKFCYLVTSWLKGYRNPVRLLKFHLPKTVIK